MCNKMKSFLAVFLFSAACASASAWDESPIAPRSSQKSAGNGAAQNATSEKNGKAGDEVAPSAVRENEVLDTRDNQVYHIVEFSGDSWTEENLNFKAPGSFCYENKEKNCQKAGRLYTWNAALSACPDGWRLPTSRELGRFLMHKSLSSKTVSGGFRKFNGDFYDFEQLPYFWTSDTDPDYKDYAIYWTRIYSGWEEKGFYKDQAHSVRCIKGEDPRKTKIYRSNSKGSAFDRF